jgi:hypothetical protein
MICEFLPIEYKRRLVRTATVDDLIAVGYTPKSAQNAKRLEIISDARCDQLIMVLGKKALPIVEDALAEFVENVSKVKEWVNSGSKPNIQQPNVQQPAKPVTAQQSNSPFTDDEEEDEWIDEELEEEEWE